MRALAFRSTQYLASADSFWSVASVEALVRAFLGLGGAGDGAGFAIGRVLGDAMGDEIHRVIAGHVLLLQEIGGVAFAFGEDGDQHIGAGHFGAARGLHMDRGALDHALEGGGRHRFGAVDVGHQIGQIIVDEFDQRVAQLVGIDRTGLHHAGRVGFVDQRQKQMLQRCEFMLACVGQRQRRVDCLFECGRE